MFPSLLIFFVRLLWQGILNVTTAVPWDPVGHSLSLLHPFVGQFLKIESE
jgi:hypothetical protein